jgi:hypothetical protein
MNPELNLNLSNLLYNFINNFFNNITSDLLSKIFNNHLYYFHINKNISISNYINISYIKKKIVFYKKIIININNLRFMFKDFINSINKLLENELLFGLPFTKYKKIILKKYSQYKDQFLIIPYKYFRDLSPHVNNSNNFVKHVIFRQNDLFNQFFTNNNIFNLDFIYYYLKNIK